MKYLLLFHTETFLASLSIIFFCCNLSFFVCPKNLLLGAATAFLLLIGAADISYFVCFYFGLSTYLFIIIFIIFLIFSISFFKRKYLNINEILEPNNRTYIVLSLIIFLYVFLSRTLAVWEASAGSHFFQAWYPLYAAYVAKIGHFNVSNGNNLTEGFLLSAQYYAPNSLGLILLASILGIRNPHNLFYIYNSLGILATTFTYILLLQTIPQKNYMAQAILLISLFLFSALDYNFQLILIGNFSEEVLYFAAAFVCFYFIYILRNNGKYRSELFELLVIFSAFMVLGRNYGLYYLFIFGVIAASFILHNIYKNSTRGVVSSLFSMILQYKVTLLFIFAVCIKEVMQSLIYGQYYPRKTLTLIYPYTYEMFKAGVISGLNIGYLKDEVVFNIHSVFIISTLLILTFSLWITKKRDQYLFRSLIPLIFLLLPFALEIITQYRKSPDFSKLYVPFIWFSAWYPAYCYATTEQHFEYLEPNKYSSIRYTYILFLFIFFTYALSFSHYRLTTLNQYVSHLKNDITNKLQKTMSYEPTDLLLTKKILRAKSNIEIQSIKQRPLMYFHYEPGLAFRYYFDGDISSDYDFYSSVVQNTLNKSSDIQNFFCKLGYPNLIYYPINNDSLGYLPYVNFVLPSWFQNEFNSLLSDNEKLSTIEVGGLYFSSFKTRRIGKC